MNQVTVSATDAKKEFGMVLEKVLQGNAVVITKHDAPKAVVLSIEDFQSLTGKAGTRLESLTTEFDQMLAAMQRPASRRAMQQAFAAPPARLAKAALSSARKRG